MGLDMKNMKIQDIAPGMVTATDVLASSGHLLLPAGTKLTTRYIRMLHARDISYVAIESDEESPSPDHQAPPRPTVVPDEHVNRLMKRFQYNDLKNSFIKELVRICTSRLMDRA